MLYRAKSVFIRTLKQTENIVPEIYSMPFSFVEWKETRMMGNQMVKKFKISLAI